MKSLIRNFLFNFISFYAVVILVPGVQVEAGPGPFLTVVSALTAISYLIKPMANFILAPINLFTLGLTGFFVNAIFLYLLSLFLPVLKLTTWFFPGYSYNGYIIPAYDFGVFQTAILGSFLLSFFHSLLKWIRR